MVAKKYQNPKGGLNGKGRKHFGAKDGGNLKAPVKSGTNPRRVSFAARFAGMKGSPGLLVIVAVSSPTVILGKRPRILLKSSSAIESRFFILIFINNRLPI